MVTLIDNLRSNFKLFDISTGDLLLTHRVPFNMFNVTVRGAYIYSTKEYIPDPWRHDFMARHVTLRINCNGREWSISKHLISRPTTRGRAMILSHVSDTRVIWAFYDDVRGVHTHGIRIPLSPWVASMPAQKPARLVVWDYLKRSVE